MGFIVAYPLWLLIQSSYTGLLAGCAQGLLRWLDQPPWIHALEASDERILIFSFLGGFERPTAVWDGETMGVFVLAPLLAMIALPGLRSGARWTGAILALLIGFVSCLAIVVLQTQLIAAEHAASRLGIEIFSATRLNYLAHLNHAIHSIGMLAIPSILWLAGYARVRWAPADASPIRRQLAALAGQGQRLW